MAHPSSGATSSTAATHTSETYRDLATDFGISTTTAFRYLRAAPELLAPIAPSLQQAIEVARESPTSTSTGPCRGSTGSP